MPRHMHIDEEDFKGRKLYDTVLAKRMLKYAKPYLLLMLLAFVLLIAVSVIEIYLPYITGEAIDSFIIMNNQLLDFGDDSELRESTIARYGGAMFAVGKDSFLIDGLMLDPADMTRLLSENIIVAEKYLALRLDQFPAETRDTVESLIAAHSDKFFPVGDAAGETITLPKKLRMPFTKPRILEQPDFAISYDILSSIPEAELKILRSNHLSGLHFLATLFFILLAFSFVINFAQIYSLHLVSQRIMHDLRVQLFAHIQRLSLKFFDSTPIGKIVTRTTNDVNTIAEMFTSVLVTSLRDFITLFGIGILIFYMSWKLSLFVVILVPMIVIATIAFRKMMREAYRWYRRALATINAKISEDLSGIRIIQAFVQERRLTKKFSESNEDYYNGAMRMLWVNAIFRPIISLFENCAISLVIWFGGGQVIQQAMSLGMLIIFLSYVRMFFRPIIAIADKFSIMQSAMAAAERIFGLLDTKPEIIDPDEPYSPAREQIRSKVEFKNV